MNTLGTHLARARKAKHLTQEELAEQANISVSQIGRLERNECAPTLDTLAALSEILDVGIDEFLYDYFAHDLANSVNIQNPNIKHVVAMMEAMGDQHCKHIEDLIAVYSASHHDK